MRLVTADNFTLEQLTEAYNQTRVDYLVPMPMNVAKLREYVNLYDVDLSKSFVAMEGNEMYGLGMLGVRHNDWGWITRLGVLPSGRRKGVGGALMEGMLDAADFSDFSQVWLEVIKGNAPAHKLFTKLGFVETRELIIARRPPNPTVIESPEGVKQVTALNHEDALILLSHRKSRPNWLNATETMSNAKNLSALVVELENGGRGWVTYHAGLLQLTRIVVEVTAGDPTDVTEMVLKVLHERHKRQDAKAENVPEDAQWEGYKRVGYFDSFRRIEMVRDRPT